MLTPTERRRPLLAWRKSRAWRVFRVVWVAAGVSVLAWLALAYSARGVDAGVLRTGERVRVEETDRAIWFRPTAADAGTALLFLPGALVDPDAYAPLLHRVAAAGHPAVLVKLPSLGGRHAAGTEGRREAVRRALAVLESGDGGNGEDGGSGEAAGAGGVRWVVAGHSLGGLLAAMVAREAPPALDALALLGTTHPRDFSLADADYPIVKVYGTRDGIAPPDRMRANAAMLPPSTRWVAIEGGNHSQFGYYGFQLRDRRARLSREAQQDRVLATLLTLLRGDSPADDAASGSAGSGSAALPAATTSVEAPRLTWLSVTNWLLEAGDTRVLLDGYLTRIDRTLVEADGSSSGTARTDTAELRRLLRPALPSFRLDRILVGQAHWDHAFDVPAIAALTGARIAGARSVCHQATALGVDAPCAAVVGGEAFEVGRDVRVRVVRWHHSGDLATDAGRRLSAPLELRAPPPVDPTTGGLRPGFLDDYPNGGGSLAYLLTVGAGDEAVTVFWSTTGNPAAWDAPLRADTAWLRSVGVDLSNLVAADPPTSTRDALAAALRAEGLDGVDYWLGAPDARHVRQVLPLLRPRVFVPHHWDDFWAPIDDGPGEPLDHPALAALLDSANVRLHVPERYYQALPLTPR